MLFVPPLRRSSKCWRWCAQHWCLSGCLLFLLLLLIILLSVLLQPKKHAIRFTTAPAVQLLGAGFADIGGRLSASASVYYVLVRTAQNTSAKPPSAADVISTALVRRQNVQLQVRWWRPAWCTHTDACHRLCSVGGASKHPQTEIMSCCAQPARSVSSTAARWYLGASGGCG
jgi:hypothetical protein